VIAVPLNSDLYSQAHQISGVNFRPVPLLLVASTWYLVVTSILMVGQYFLEKYFAKGSSRKMTKRQLQALANALGGTNAVREI
jgi:polar amino acid transport system permease protein